MFIEEYKKDLNRNYLVFSENEEQEMEQDGLQMLLQNDIRGVLRLEQRSIDNKSQYYYDVTGMQKLSELCRMQKLRKKELTNLLLGIANILEQGTVYFLEGDGFILNPEYIYVKTSAFRNTGGNGVRLKENGIRLCYYPGKSEDAGEQLNHLLEYLINQIDYKDEEAVAQIYELYQRSCDVGFHPLELREMLKAEREIPTREEWRGERQKENSEREDLERKNEGNNWNIRKKSFSQEAGKGLTFERKREEDFGRQKFVKTEADSAIKFQKEKVFLFAGMLLVLALFAVLYWKGFFFSPFTGQVKILKLAGTGLVVLLVEAFLSYRLYLQKGTGAEASRQKQPSGKGKREEKSYGKQQGRRRIEEDRYSPEYNWGDMEEKRCGQEYKGEGMGESRYFQKQGSGEVKESRYCQEQNREGMGENRYCQKQNLGKMFLGAYSEKKMQEESEGCQAFEEEKTQLLTEMEKTVLLCGQKPEKEGIYYLQPVGEETADRIPVTEFPFFWGKIPMKGKRTIENRAISRFHAKIEKEGEDFFLTDLNSTNGTFLNHVRLEANQPSLLKPGDEVMFADSVYRFTLAQ